MGSRLSAPSAKTRLARSEGRPLVLAHRGGRGPWRENTIAAFSGALSGGADGVELDVRLGADGTLFVHHDPAVEGVGHLHELRRDQVPQWVPTLYEALDACAGAVVDVEIKSSPLDPGHDPAQAVAYAVVGVLEELAGVARRGERGGTETEVFVSSFAPATVRAVASAASAGPLAGELQTGLLVAPAFDPLSLLEECAALGATILLPFHAQVTKRLVESAHDWGLAVVTWTVNEPKDLESVLGSGVDGIVSDDVDAAVRATVARSGLVSGADPRGQSGA